MEKYGKNIKYMDSLKLKHTFSDIGVHGSNVFSMYFNSTSISHNYFLNPIYLSIYFPDHRQFHIAKYSDQYIS